MTGDDAASSPLPGVPGHGVAEQGSEEADLLESVADLSRLATGRLALDEVLHEVADFAVRATPNAEGAGLALLQDNREDLVVATAEFVRQVHDVQYGIGEGPCISAVAEGRTVVAGSLGADRRWPRFGGSVARLGVHSALSLPLITPDGVLGAINVYAHAKNAFDSRAAEIAQLFAVPAAIAVQNAQVLDETRRLATQLAHAVQTRGVIDRAVGILISRSGATPEAALARLRQISQSEHRKLTAVAESIIDEAARRARARQQPDAPTS